MRHQFASQQIEQILTPRLRAKAIDRMHDAATHEPMPEAVGERPREPAVGGLRHDLGELREPGWWRQRGIDLAQVGEDPRWGRHHAGRLVAAGEFQRQIGGDRGKIVGLPERPAIDKTIVAARALEVDAKKRLADVLGELDRHGLARVHGTPPDDAVDEAARLIGG